MTKIPFVYLVVAGAVVHFLVIGAIVTIAKSGLIGPAIALAVWLVAACIIGIAWLSGRVSPSGPRRFTQLWHHDRQAASLLVKVIIGALLLIGVALATLVAR